MLWFRHAHPRRSIPVVFMDDEQCQELNGEHPLGGEKVALWDDDSWTLIVWAGLTRSSLHEIVLHELAHACFDNDALGVGRMTEEKAIVSMQTNMAESLRRQGWRLPPLPDGWRGFSQHARALRRKRGE